MRTKDTSVQGIDVKETRKPSGAEKYSHVPFEAETEAEGVGEGMNEGGDGGGEGEESSSR